MNYLLLTLTVLLLGCGQKESSYYYGRMTVKELVSQKGDFIKEEAIPVEDGKILIYPDDEKYQVKGDIVTNSYRNPVGDEVQLIFWKNKFKDCITYSKLITKPQSGHELQEYELGCEEKGISVSYVEGSETVLRVMEYEKK